jgi:RNA polymerase sigma-70 factor (ECF subfamily)
MDIVQIIDGCKRNEVWCQKILYDRFYGYALKIAFRYVYRYDLAVNVTNDGFVKVFNYIDRFDYKDKDFPEQLLMAWIKLIVVNKSIDELRKNKMKPEIGSIPEYVWESADDNLEADQFLLFKELIGYIKKLPPMYRIVFNMFVIDGYTHVEIAKSLRISVGKSKSDLSRARVILQKIVKDKEHVKSWSLNSQPVFKLAYNL